MTYKVDRRESPWRVLFELPGPFFRYDSHNPSAKVCSMLTSLTSVRTRVKWAAHGIAVGVTPKSPADRYFGKRAKLTPFVCVSRRTGLIGSTYRLHTQ